MVERKKKEDKKKRGSGGGGGKDYILHGVTEVLVTLLRDTLRVLPGKGEGAGQLLVTLQMYFYLHFTSLHSNIKVSMLRGMYVLYIVQLHKSK